MLLKKINNFIFNNLNFGRIKISGRNNTGRITVRHRGGGVNRIYRIVDFSKYVWDVRAIILAINYDPNRSSLLALFAYTNSIFSFNLCSQGLRVGNTIVNSNIDLGFEYRINYTANLNYLKPGIYINNIEFKPFRGSKYVRTANNYAKLVSTAASYSILKLRSKTLLKVSNTCIATVGILSNKYNYLKELGRNAGFYRHMGFRPTVRGVAMNPIDHPHGGGQGKTSGGRPSVTPWAEITKGRRTRRKINYGSFIMKR
jgi:large subunit ribosomal protein L2